MSTSGTYSYWPKVEHPNAIFPQMASASLQPSFYFGGSQVPVNLGVSHGSGFGFRSQHKSSLESMKQLDTQGRGINVAYNRHHNIALPKHMSTIRRVI